MLTIIKKVFDYLFEFSDKNWHHLIFIYSLYLSYFLFFIAITGIVSIPNNYLHILHLVINYYIIFVLLIRFNPFISHDKLTEFDRRIVFTAAIYMLLSSTMYDYVYNYVHFSIF
jgi:hypothetical protein